MLPTNEEKFKSLAVLLTLWALGSNKELHHVDFDCLDSNGRWVRVMIYPESISIFKYSGRPNSARTAQTVLAGYRKRRDGSSERLIMQPYNWIWEKVS